MAEQLGVSGLERRSIAATVASAAALSATALGEQPQGAGAWLATPLHWVAGLDTLHLARDGCLALSEPERVELAASFNDTLGGGGLTLQSIDGADLLLCGLALPAVTTVEPASCASADLARLQPGGEGAAALRRLMAEIELWLHGHPLNQRRESRGQRPVRSLWLWGGGALREGSMLPAESGVRAESVAAARRAPGSAAPALQVYSDDVWVRAAARLAHCPLAPVDAGIGAATFVLKGDALATSPRPGVVDPGNAAGDEWAVLRAAAGALEAGLLQRLTVIGAQRSVSVAAGDRWRLWRSRRGVLEALGRGLGG